MIPDFPHNIRIRLAQLKFFCCPLTLLKLCPVGCLSLAFQNWDSQQGRDLATSGRNRQKFEESLVSSNLNSKQLRFHGAHPNVHTYMYLHKLVQRHVLLHILPNIDSWLSWQINIRKVWLLICCSRKRISKRFCNKNPNFSVKTKCDLYITWQYWHPVRHNVHFRFRSGSGLDSGAWQPHWRP